MTTLLEQAITEIEKLPDDMQDAIAARILAEMEDEVIWSARFTATTDEQWTKMADLVRAEIASGDVMPLDKFLSSVVS